MRSCCRNKAMGTVYCMNVYTIKLVSTSITDEVFSCVFC